MLYYINKCIVSNNAASGKQKSKDTIIIGKNIKF